MAILFSSLKNSIILQIQITFVVFCMQKFSGIFDALGGRRIDSVQLVRDSQCFPLVDAHFMVRQNLHFDDVFQCFQESIQTDQEIVIVCPLWDQHVTDPNRLIDFRQIFRQFDDAFVRPHCQFFVLLAVDVFDVQAGSDLSQPTVC